MSKTSKIAIALAIIAGVLALSRALYNYNQSGKWDIGKIAIGIAIPCFVYAIVKSLGTRK
jgi:ABC-type microcin C transport system permease subunit YejB